MVFVRVMTPRDKRVDAYIDGAPPFARPILRHLRQIVHRACPEVEETLNWGQPHFLHHGILCSISATDNQCALRLWRTAELAIGTGDVQELPELLGRLSHLASLTDVPSSSVLVELLKRAMTLNENGSSPPASTPSLRPKRVVVVPAALQAASANNRRAKATFDSLSASHQREYADWIAEAKREQTQTRRIETTLAYLEQGKPLNWKYAKG